MNIEDLRKYYKEDILKVAEKYGVTNIRVFGSIVKGTASDKSDIDLVAKFPENISLIEYSKIIRDMENTIGKKVDLLSENGINKYIKDEILNNSIIL